MYNVKKLRHNKKKREYEQLKYWASQSDQNRRAIGFARGNILQWPTIRLKGLSDFETLSQEANNERKHAIFEVLNWRYFNSNREEKLKPYYRKHKPLRWQAMADSVSVKTINGHTRAYLLLNQITDRDKMPKDGNYSILDTSYCDCVIDKHMWLPLAYVKYLNGVSEMEIAQGDVIQGESYIHQYYSEDKIKYGLASTIIRGCGIFTGTDDVVSDIGDEVINMSLFSDYHRDSVMLKLFYNTTYSAKFNRYRKIDWHALRYISGHVNYRWNVDEQIDYRYRFMAKPDAFEDIKRVVRANNQDSQSYESQIEFENMLSHHQFENLNTPVIPAGDYTESELIKRAQNELKGAMTPLSKKLKELNRPNSDLKS